MEIIYEPHPVSPERKAELRKQGLKIIDARFAPVDHKPSEAGAGEGEKGKKPSHGLRVDDIKAKLTEKSIAFDDAADRATLAKLLDEAPE